ncbi:uncharacterized protein LOC123909366 [Trifolium pratense]|uniref:uncharacterized protein LOC123909366 n=1 Tax=Trifolium pratense TaxID=57577 RepID=UPI001E693539|nr:uncharacterized protein LOC123909366 [Trifolium pratense]
MFDPTKKHHQPNNSFDLYDETRHETSEATNYNNIWPLKKPQLGLDDDEPRWSMNSPHYRSLSPVSRKEAIVRGQKELMEMVRNMPETNYELSLKDLVEHHHRVVNTREENTEEEEKKMMKKNLSGKKIDNKTVEIKKNGKIDHDQGFYLKMGLPFFSLRSKDKKKKKKESKVSPRPSISDGQVKEKEWCKKGSSDYKESDDSAASSMISNGSIKSSTSSSSNGSIRSRSRRLRSNSIILRREKGGGLCWAMFRRPKIQTKK